MFFTPIDVYGKAGRTVIRNIKVVDTTPPVLTMGNPNVLREVGAKFYDPYYTVSDNYRPSNQIKVVR